MRKSTLKKLKQRRLEALSCGNVIVGQDTAIHEAAHAAVAELRGIRVRQVRIGAGIINHHGYTLGCKGLTEYEQTTVTARPVPDMVAVYCAGYVADAKTGRTTEPFDQCELTREDYRIICRLLEQLQTEPPPEWKQQAIELGISGAAELLSKKYVQTIVEEIATLLMRERIVSGDKVRAIVERHSGGERAA